MKQFTRRVAALVATLVPLTALTSCGGSAQDSDTVTLVTHDSFAASDQVLKEFTERTGYRVRLLRGGDAGTTVNQAVLAKDRPQGDVLFGVDNTLLSRVLKAGVLTPYRAKGLDRIPKELRLDAEHRVTPVDFGDVCVNYDRSYFAERDLEPPRAFDDLIRPEYRDLLVTPNPATSSPGLAFLLGTVGEYGEKGWRDYWKKLKANGVEVVNGWEQAYNDRFSGSRGGRGQGDRPLVVSYASSPPVEVVGVKPRPERAPTGVATGTCFRQIEFAGLLSGAGNVEGGKALLDFLISESFQRDLPLRMFVHPAREDVQLPELFTRYAEEVPEPSTVSPERIAAGREEWVDQWSSLVLR